MNIFPFSGSICKDRKHGGGPFRIFFRMMPPTKEIAKMGGGQGRGGRLPHILADLFSNSDVIKTVTFLHPDPQSKFQCYLPAPYCAQKYDKWCSNLEPAEIVWALDTRPLRQWLDRSKCLQMLWEVFNQTTKHRWENVGQIALHSGIGLNLEPFHYCFSIPSFLEIIMHKLHQRVIPQRSECSRTH